MQTDCYMVQISGLRTNLSSFFKLLKEHALNTMDVSVLCKEVLTDLSISISSIQTDTLV